MGEQSAKALKVEVLLKYYRERCADSRQRASQYSLLWINFVGVSITLMGLGVQQKWVPFLGQTPVDDDVSFWFLVTCALFALLAAALFGYAHLCHFAIVLHLQQIEDEINGLLNDKKSLDFAWHKVHREKFIATTGQTGINWISVFLIIGLLPISTLFITYIMVGLWRISEKPGAAFLVGCGIGVVALIGLLLWRKKKYVSLDGDQQDSCPRNHLRRPSRAADSWSRNIGLH